MLRRRIVLIFFLLTLLPLSILGVMVYERFSNTLEQNAIEATEKVIEQMNHNLDLLFADLARMSLSPLYDESILSILKKHHDPKNRFYRSAADNERISMFLSGLMYKRSELQGVHLITNDGNVFSHLDRNELRAWFDPQAEDEWYTEVLEADGAWVILPAHTPSYYRIGHQEQYFSVARLIRDPQTYQHLGLIKVDAKLSYMDELVHSLDEALIRVEDEKGRLLYENQKFNLDSQTTDQRTWSDWVDYENVRYLVMMDTSAATGISIQSFVPKEMILSQTKQLGQVIFMLMCVSALVAFMLAYISSRRIVRPIEELKGSMEQVQQGHLEERIHSTRGDEIGQLAVGFNDMVEEINRLLKEIYERGLREKEAEYKALQSQINPHFIFNTLESINMKALEKGDFELSDMVSGLGRLLRYSTDQSQKMVKIKEEVKVVEAFLYIMQIRLGERLEVEWDIERQLLEYTIPKLSIQPIVENAVFHGLSPLESGGKLWIRIKERQGTIHCIIEDNGAGMSGEQISRIKEQLRRTRIETKESIGLWNIHQRMIYKYGAQYGIDIAAEEGFGTSVRLMIPKNGVA